MVSWLENVQLQPEAGHSPEFIKGSSAIQIVPSLQPRVKKLVNFARGKAWISATWAKERLLELSNNVDVPNCKLSLHMCCWILITTSRCVQRTGPPKI